MRAGDPVSDLPGCGPARARSLQSIGIGAIGDLLMHYPRDHDDLSEIKTIETLVPDAVNTLRGRLSAEPELVTFAAKNDRGRAVQLTKARLRDGTGELLLVWFNQPYLKKNFAQNGLNQEYIFTGKVSRAYGRLQMDSPSYEKCGGELLSSGRIVPVYTIPSSITQKQFRAFIHAALRCVDTLPDDLPAAIRKRQNLCGIDAAVGNIHFPESNQAFLDARRRLVFEELFFAQLALLTVKHATSQEEAPIFSELSIEPFLSALPYPLTCAQRQVLEAIAKDFASGRRMNRLVQGDVGSGKTAVAMAACFMAAGSGYQSTVMAPTEVLANQHYESFTRCLSPLGIRTALLTGSLTRAKREEALSDIADGRAHVAVGTHALIQKGVTFRKLALAITDEQHRFGVKARWTLAEKGRYAKPHTLVMSATPIPRTLGLILYGDMDVSIINEMPPGRVPVSTYCVDSSYRQRIHNFIRKEVSQGNQAYVICPAIGGDETEDGPETDIDMLDVTQYTRGLTEALPGVAIASLHGRMPAAEKERVMNEFKDNKISVVVSTTVIEVGVHAENATLVVIENAERFGLSTLHQLRGRVGRGRAKSYCVLVTDMKNKQTKARMDALVQTTDGFVISEIDLNLRGSGDFFGVRQHGLPSFKIANLYRDLEILPDAQAAAQAVIAHECEMQPGERERLERRVKTFLRPQQSGAVL